jgi:hypothetical protein
MTKEELVAVYSSKISRVKAGSLGRTGMITREIAMLKEPHISIGEMFNKKSEVVRVSSNVVKRVR